MKKFLIFVILIVLIVIASLIFDQKLLMNQKDNKNPENNQEHIRKPAVSGKFYPANKDELSSTINNFILEAELLTIEGEIKGLIVPHAGYQFSGQVAAYAYKTLEKQAIDTIILIGPSHYEQFEGASVYSKGYYETPLGKIKVDEKVAQKVIDSSKKISFRESIHIDEHSLEVQLPFLQKVLNNDFKIVPIIIGNQSKTVDILIKALKQVIDKNTLIIASSDLSHYPSYEDAKYADNKVIKAILTKNKADLKQSISELMQENIPNLQTCACGQEAIEVLMELMKGKEARLLKYANSADSFAGKNTKERVVGYSAIAFFEKKEAKKENKAEIEIEFSNLEKEKLLAIAKSAVEIYIRQGKTVQLSSEFTNLEKHLGAFVTLRKYGQLRGCIGSFVSNQPLYLVIRDMAIAAATQDARFNAVKEDELDDLEYEISILSPLKKVSNWKEIEIGKHGVQIRKGINSGVFLPQVATDNNWDLETFLSTLCEQKAGLPANCFKDSNTDLYVFTAKIFQEQKVR